MSNGYQDIDTYFMGEEGGREGEAGKKTRKSRNGEIIRREA